MIGARTLSSEMNETSTTARSIGSGRVSDVSVRAFVRSSDVTRSSRAQRLGELSATHVESVDVPRAALQQHVREAARGGSDVERA